MTTTDRTDGRSLTTLRPLSCELSTLRGAHGSALWKAGGTHVLAAVHGPQAPRQPQYELPQAVVSVCLKSATGSVTLEREWEDFLQHTLTACIVVQDYAASVIQVVIQILTDDGSVLGACLHATVAALMDAGIDMVSLPVATTCVVDDGPVRLDPTRDEEKSAGTIVIASETPGKVLGCHTNGIQTDMTKILQCCRVAEKAVPAVTAFWRLAIEQRTTRESQTLWATA